MKKIIPVLIVMLTLFVIMAPVCFATLENPLENPDKYTPSYNITSNNQKFIEKGNVILGIIRIVGTFVSVITLMIFGIKYMLGSAQQKAQYKETMIPYIVGAIMLFAIPNIIGVVYDIVKNVKIT